VALKAVFFDVGETLVNEQGYWGRVARLLGIPPHVVFAALGVTIARGESHKRVYDLLGVERPDAVDAVVYGRGELYHDAIPCLARLHADGYTVGVAGNQTEAMERWARDESLPVDVIGSSASWGIEKPSPAFFARIAAELALPPEAIAYVGDRVDNDVNPAAAAGMTAIFIRRGPWAWIQCPVGTPAAAAFAISDLTTLPELLRA